MVGARVGLRLLVRRGLEASTGKLTDGVSGELRPSRSVRGSGGQRLGTVSGLISGHWFLAAWKRARAS